MALLDHVHNIEAHGPQTWHMPVACWPNALCFVGDRTVSRAKRYRKICSTNKALLALHLLQEVVGTPVEDRTVSNSKRAELATVPGYIPTQYPTQLHPLGASTFTQAEPNVHACPHNVSTLCQHLQCNTVNLYFNLVMS
jgi:hypothetical protein